MYFYISFTHSFMHLLDQYLLGGSSVPGTALEGKPQRSPLSWSLHSIGMMREFVSEVIFKLRPIGGEPIG